MSIKWVRLSNSITCGMPPGRPTPSMKEAASLQNKFPPRRSYCSRDHGSAWLNLTTVLCAGEAPGGGARRSTRGRGQKHQGEEPVAAIIDTSPHNPSSRCKPAANLQF